MNINLYQGKLIAKDIKIAIVISRFNDFINTKLLEGAVDALTRHGVEEENIDVYYVPGAFEIPMVAKRLAKNEEHDGIICLGCVIRGATSHYEYVCSEVSKGIASISIEYEKPVMFGVLTTEDIEQAIERAGSKSGNKGYECGEAVIEMVNLMRQI